MYLYIILLILDCNDVAIGQSVQNVKDLLTHIYTTNSYNTKVRPASDQSEATTVYLDYVLTGILDFDETEGSLTTTGHLEISWNDQVMTWTPASYGGVHYLLIPQQEIWKPDIALENSFQSFTELGSKFISVYVTSDGTVLWTPFQVLKSICSVDITYFPFDIQTCELTFIAWSYTKLEVYIQEGTKGIVLDKYEENSEWDLVETSHKVEEDSFESAIIFILKLRRKPLFVVLNVIIPVLFLTILSTCVFILPVSSGERAGFSITVFLSLAVFLTIVSSLLPQNSDSISYMSEYLMIMAGISTLIVIISVIQMRLYDRDYKKDPVPSWLVRLIRITTIKPNKASCCRKRRSMVSNSVVSLQPGLESKDTPDKEDDKHCSWVDAVNTLDLIFFLLFFFTVLITTVISYCLAAYPNSQK